MAPDPEPPTIVVDGDRVERPDGWVVQYYRVNFADAATLRAELDRWKTPQAKIEPWGGAQSINFLRIEERKENLPLLEKLLQVLDQPVPQVLVRAKLVEISYDGNLEWGFDAKFERSGADPLKTSETFFRGGSGTFNPDAFLNASTQRPYQGTELGFAFLGDTKARYGSLDVVIRALKSSGKAEILGEPNILATQGQKATLSAGEELPLQTSTLSGGNLVVNTIFKKTGITLDITPDLIGRDAVRLKLKQEFSAVTGFLAGQGGVQNPIVNNRSADTTVTVRDGATLVVGGLQSSRTRETTSGIPLLMDIPGLGYLFSTNDREEVKTELYFFLTVEIVRGSYAEGVIAPPGERSRLEGLEGTR